MQSNTTETKVETPVKNQEKVKDPNLLVEKWINLVWFKEKVTRMLFKAVKNKNFVNARIIIKTNDYKLDNGYVTVTAQLTLKGLKDLNIAAYDSAKIIVENMKENEKKGEPSNNKK